MSNDKDEVNAPEAIFPSPEAPWDPLKAIEELRRAFPARSGRKLSLMAQCEAFAALRAGAPNGVVAKIFGVSPAAITQLRNCLNRQRLNWRYPDVWRTWRDMGEKDFMQRYFTQELDEKIRRFKYDQQTKIDDATLAGPNPRANKYAFALMGEFIVPSETPWRARVDWIDCAADTPEHRRGPIGWRFSIVDEGLPDLVVSQASDDNIALPWRTSADAYDAAFTHSDLPTPRAGAGRPRK